MATIKKVYSDNGRTHLLQTTVNAAKNDAGKGNFYVSNDTLQSILAFLPVWEQKTQQVNQYLSLREKEIREKKTAVSFLDTVMRDIWEVQKRRVKRQNLPAEVLTYYQLPLSGTVPKISREKDLFTMAAHIIKGDAEAVNAGYEALMNPSAKELHQALEQAKKEYAEIAPADRNYDAAEEAVAELRETADNLIADVVDEMKFNLRKRDGSSQRRIIQSYGIEIIYNTDKTPDNDNEDLE